MGNHQSNKRKVSNDDIGDNKLTQKTVRHKKQKKSKKSKWNKLAVDGATTISDPKTPATTNTTVTTAAPPPVEEEDLELDVKIYQSYAAGEGGGKNVSDESQDDIRLYRRNKDALNQQRKHCTAPNFHNRCLALRDYPELGRRTLQWESLSNSVRSSNKASDTSSLLTDVGPTTVEKKDFPSASIAKERVKQFEHSFVRSFIEKFSRLSCKAQLSSVSVAIRPRDSSAAAGIHVISLYAFFKSQVQVISSANPAGKDDQQDYILTIPDEQLLSIQRMRRETNHLDPEVLTKAALDIVACVVGEAASEVGRVFEYQIALLEERASVEMLANHAADCTIDYVVRRNNRLLDRNTVVQGVIRGNPKTTTKSQVVSVIVGSQEVKWELTKILKKPGLRKDALLFTQADDVQDLESPRWTFHSPKHSEPLVYGYRGLVVERDFRHDATYRLDRDDALQLREEDVVRHDDFHRLYVPYHCLVGAGFMELCKTANKGASDEEILNRYALRFRENGNTDKKFQLVYRPMTDSGRNKETSAIVSQRKVASVGGYLKTPTFSEINGPDNNNCENANRTSGKIEEECQDQDVVRCVNLPSRQKIDAVDINEAPTSVVKATEGKPRGEFPLIDEDEDATVDYGRKESESERSSEKENKRTDNSPNESAETQMKTSEDNESRFNGNDGLIRRNISAGRVPLVRLSGIVSTEDETKFEDESPAKRAENDENQCKANRLNIVRDDFASLKKNPTNDRPLQRNSFLAENAQIKDGLKKKIIQALEVLKVGEIPTQLPEVDLQGRKVQVSHLTEMLTPPGSMVTITGCYGIGKSSVALAIGHSLKTKSVTSVYVDCRGSCLFTSFLQRIVRQFGLRFKIDEISCFYNWLNCHDQQLLIILDNVDLPEELNEILSQFTDDLLRSVHKLRIVCTRIHPFYQGRVASGRRNYRLGDIRESSDRLFLQVAPDLRDKDIEMLSSMCGHVPFSVRLISNVLAFEDVASSSILRSLSSNGTRSGLPTLERELRELARDECERKQLRNIVASIFAVLDNISEIYTEILCKMSVYAASFELEEILTVVQATNSRDAAVEAIHNLYRLGLVVNHGSTHRFHLPPAVKLVCQNLLTKDSSRVAETFYQLRALEKLQDACSMYGSANHRFAKDSVEPDFDNVADAVVQLSESETLHEEVSWTLASFECAVFLTDFLPEDVYCGFFRMLKRSADRSLDAQRQCRALACLAYNHVVNGRVGQAAFSASRAFDMSAAVDGLDRAFCLLCLAKVYWHDVTQQTSALRLAKRAVDLYRVGVGLNDIRTVYACEVYGEMLTATDCLHTALRVFNVADDGVAEMGLDGHPQLVVGCGCRRLIWDELGLFERAKQMARAASRLTSAMYGDHPKTATALMQLCEATVKRGSISDALCVCIHSLAMRIKVLGESFETGISYKMLSYLMFRQTQYEGAAAFGQRALEIFRKFDADGELIEEVNDVMSQARQRMSSANQNNSETIPEQTTTKDNGGGARKNVTFQELVRLSDNASLTRMNLAEV